MDGSWRNGATDELDEELILGLRVLAREEIDPPLGMISRMEAGVLRSERTLAPLSPAAAAVAGSVVFAVASLAYVDFFSVGFAAALAVASGLYGFSLRWILDPMHGAN